MIFLRIAGLYLFSSLASISEGALVQTDISGQLAAANGNRTALKTQIVHGIAAGPAYRGTFDIVWSCLLTILACIYNAIHLNVPPRNTGKWMLLLRKVKWATMALFAPEIVLYTATTQLLDAYKVKKEVNAMRGQIRGKKKPELINLRYGFYVAMGGFVYDVKNLRDDLSFLTITPRGIIALARQGQFVDIKPEDITDKSKADILTKSLICIQVSWMVIQCIARKAAGYPLTLLEIHTMVHVVCALTLYVLWWKKPYDIIEATVFYAANYDSYRATVALMLMGSDLPDRWLSEACGLCFDGQVRLNKNVDGLAVSGQETSVADKDEKTKQVLGKSSTESGDFYVFNSKLEQAASSPKATVCTLCPGQYLPCGIGCLENTEREMTSVDIRRWELCASTISEILKITSPRNEYDAADTVKVRDLDRFIEERELDETFDTHIPNVRIDHLLRDWDEHIEDRISLLRETGHLLLYLFRFFIPLTAAYGGIHLSAWKFEFPSHVESVIWRTACFIIMGSSLALLIHPSWVALYHFFLFYYRDGRQDWKVQRNYAKQLRGSSKFTKPVIKTAGYGFASLLLLCYVASRLYLVVESFVSLRQVPVGVYAAVPWVENIPHV